VEEEGTRLIEGFVPTANTATKARRYRKVRGFIRQAENYYRAAEKIHYRSSALLYYYGILNLAKAALEIRGIDYREEHGLSPYFSESSELGAQAVVVQARGIFPALYRFEFGEETPKIRIGISALLARVSETSFQYMAAGYGKPAITPHSRARVRANVPNREMRRSVTTSDSFRTEWHSVVAMTRTIQCWFVFSTKLRASTPSRD
jgi:hypothetical protein